MNLSSVTQRAQLPALFNERGFFCGAEVGVYKGEFSEMILSEWDGVLFSIDCWEHQTTGYPEACNHEQDEQDSNYLKTVQRLLKFRGRSHIIRAYSDVAGRLFRGMNFMLDFVIIDANHTREAADDDINNWMRSLKAGGLLCIDDYCGDFPGVIAAVDSNFGKDKGHLILNDNNPAYNPMKCFYV